MRQPSCLFWIPVLLLCLGLMNSSIEAAQQSPLPFDLETGWERDDFEPLFIMNRVQDYSFGATWKLLNEESYYPNLKISTLYSTGTKVWYPGIYAEQPFISSGLLNLWVDYGKEAQPFGFDDHILTRAENTAAAFFIREDFMDYVEVRRVAGGLRIGPFADQSLSLGMTSERHRSMNRVTQLSGLFGGHKVFPPNAMASEMEPILLKARYDWRIPGGWTPWSREVWNNRDSGLWMTWEGWWAHPDLGGKMNLSRHLVEGRFHLALNRFVKLRARAAVGWTPHGNREGFGFPIYPGREGTLVAEPGGDSFLTGPGRVPPQWTFHAGGIGTLRGHDEKEFVGDQLLLANLEYAIRPERSFEIYLFTDLGKAWYQDSAPYAGEGFFGKGQLEWDGGLGVEMANGGVRVQMGQNLRDMDKDPRFTLRLQRAF